VKDDDLVRVGKAIVENVVGVPIPKALFSDDHGTWDPVVPPDLHLAKLPPVAEDGTVACRQCRSRVAFDRVNIADQSYICSACSLANARTHAVPVDDVKLGGPNLLACAIGVLVLAGLVALVVL
jgi:hypothetical protein